MTAAPLLKAVRGASTPDRRAPKSRAPLVGTGLTLLCLAPAILALATFEYLPLGRTLLLSLQRTDLFGRPAGFVGLGNFVDLFASADFWATMGRTAVFVIGATVAKLTVGVLIATPLSGRLRRSWVARIVVLVPMAVSVAVAGAVFRTLLQPTTGLADRALAGLGLPSPGWLVEPGAAMFSVIVVDTWTEIGFTVLVLLAGMAALPEDVFEAASLDGAGAARRLWSITLPLVAPTLLFLTVYHLIAALRQFAVIRMMTGGGPRRGTTTLVVDIWDRAFGASGGEYGMASAGAILLLILVGAVTALNVSLFRQKETV